MTNTAGFWVRLGARIVDMLIVGISILILIFILQLDTSSRAVQSAEGLLTILYYTLLPVFWTGYTIGKRALGIKIIKDDGTDVNLLQMIIREFLTAFIYAFTLGILLIVSAVMIGVREDRKSIHDMLAKTQVVYRK